MDAGRVITPTRSLTFFGTNGDSITTLRIALAQTQDEITTGLMDVRTMAQNEGMLFIFDTDEPRSFWMANTPLSLDMFFVDSGFRIRRIHANTTPLSHQSYASEDLVRYVIETNAGYSILHDITEGHTIRIHD
jgi:uncharacterized protein